jgi:hypothetical protein
MELRKPGRNREKLTGNRKTFQESRKYYWYSQNLTRKAKSLQEFVKPDGNSRFLWGIRKTRQEITFPVGKP